MTPSSASALSRQWIAARSKARLSYQVEAGFAGGTGTDHCAFIGTRLLEVDLSEVYKGLRKEWLEGGSTTRLRHRLRVLIALLRLRWVDRWIGLRQLQWRGESIVTLGQRLFAWETPDEANNLSSMTRDLLPELDGRVSRLEDQLSASTTLELLSDL